LTCTPINNLRYATLRVEQLEQPQFQLRNAWVTQLEIQGGARQGRMRATYRLERANDPGIFKMLEETRTAIFSIPYDHPAFNLAGTSFVMADSVKLRMDRVPDDVAEFACRLTHTGNSMMRNKVGQLYGFQHPRRTTNLAYQRGSDRKWSALIDENKNLRGNEQFISRSPFCTWILEFTDPAGMSFKRTSAIDLEFSVTFIPADMAYQPAPLTNVDFFERPSSEQQ
jgi:hypothetical protein